MEKSEIKQFKSLYTPEEQEALWLTVNDLNKRGNVLLENAFQLAQEINKIVEV